MNNPWDKIYKLGNNNSIPINFEFRTYDDKALMGIVGDSVWEIISSNRHGQCIKEKLK